MSRRMSRGRKNRVTKVMAACAVLAGLTLNSVPGAANEHGMRPMPHPPRAHARNIIFLVPDGMTLGNVTATRIFKNGPDGEPLSFERLPEIGYQRTYSANSTITDSAAAASAWSTGDKYNNGELACHADLAVSCAEIPLTILEIAKEKGKMTGLVVTSTITHATPAAFGAHVHSRKCETEIGRQYVEETQVDVLLGGGVGPNRAGYNCEQYPSWGMGESEVVASARTNGYTYVTTESAMDEAVESGGGKILGLFVPGGGKTPENFRVDPNIVYPDEEPTLPAMTEAALAVLEQSRKGFFLMVEGSQIDWADHGNRLEVSDPAENSVLGEMLAFDRAVETVMEWVNASPKRRQETLVVVVGDHETGGFAVNGPYGSLSKAGEVVEAGWTTHGHTGVDTVVWSQGPGSRQLGRAINNTDIFQVMKQVLH